jgi:hypothetical protein
VGLYGQIVGVPSEGFQESRRPGASGAGENREQEHDARDGRVMQKRGFLVADRRFHGFPPSSNFERLIFRILLVRMKRSMIKMRATHRALNIHPKSLGFANFKKSW